MTQPHAPVLHDEAIAALEIKPDGRYVDGTYGRGGHARSILAALGAQGRLIVMDRDPEAIADARQSFGADSRVTIIHDDYANMQSQMAKSSWMNKSMESCSILACLRRRLTKPNVVSAFGRTGPWTCAWTRKADKVLPNG